MFDIFLLDCIIVDFVICYGKFIIWGLRYFVENVFELLAFGMINDEILSDYEDLEFEDL